MARIIGGIACSHTPTIGFAVDGRKQNDPVWAPMFEGFAPAKKWLAEKKPDALFMIFNDHVTSFFFDHYSAFTLGIDSQYSVADEGGGERDLPPVKGHAALAQHIGASLFADEFDMSFFQDKKLDHGSLSPLSMLCDFNDTGWPIPIVPLAVGVLLQSGQSAAQGDRKLPRGHLGGDRRNRGPFAPGQRRPSRVQQHGVGSPLHGAV